MIRVQSVFNPWLSFSLIPLTSLYSTPCHPTPIRGRQSVAYLSHVRMLREQRPPISFDHFLPREVLFKPSAPGQSHPSAQRRVVEQPSNILGHVERVPRLEQQTRDPVISVISVVQQPLRFTFRRRS